MSRWLPVLVLAGLMHLPARAEDKLVRFVAPENLAMPLAVFENPSGSAPARGFGLRILFGVLRLFAKIAAALPGGRAGRQCPDRGGPGFRHHREISLMPQLWRRSIWSKACLLSLTGWLAMSLPGQCQTAPQPRIAYFDLPPFTSTQDGKPVGKGVPLISQAVEGLPIAAEWELLSIKRLTTLMTTEPLIVFGIGRTPEREQMGFTWVRKLWESHYVFATLASHAPVDTLEQGKALRSVTCTVGSAPEALLRTAEFGNVETVFAAWQNVAKLAAGRADAWFDVDVSILNHWRLNGQERSDLRLGKPINVMESWVVASPTVDPEIVARLRDNLAKIPKSEFDAAAIR